MKNNLFTWEKREDIWKFSINGETAFMFFQSYGFPLEMFIEECQEFYDSISLQERLYLMITTWVDCVLSGKVPLDEAKEIKAKNKMSEKDFMKLWRQLSNDDKDTNP